MADEDNKPLDQEDAPTEEAVETSAPVPNDVPPPPPPPPAEPEEPAPDPDCPKCKGGAPAWMATFADMATLLMAFFVLILSFAEMNVPKYKEVSGSMNDAFGVQRKVPVVEPPLSDSVIAKQFTQAKVEPTAMSTIQEQTTDEIQPEDPELKITTKPSEAEMSADVEIVKAALADEIAKGTVEVVQQEDKISVIMRNAATVGMESGQEGTQRGRQLDQETIALYAKVAEAQTQVVSEVQVLASPTESEQTADSGAADPQIPPEDVGDSELEQIRQNLAPEINKSLVNVEMDDDQIKITLADQGSFVSGSADLRPQFLNLLSRVGQSITDTNGVVTVSGHTDNIPVAFSMRFNSNWDLSAARSASVADYLISSGYLANGSVSVQGFADTVPVDTNDTPAGRAKNRRIEITIDKKG